MAKDSHMSEIKLEYLRQKQIKKRKHARSKVRHPLKATKNGYGKLAHTTSSYWAQGKKIGANRMKKINGDEDYQPPRYYKDKDVAKYVLGKMSLTQKIISIVIVIFIVAMVVWGAMHG